MGSYFAQPVHILGISQIIGYGTLLYAFPQIADRMIADFGWSKSEVYGSLTPLFIASALTAMPAGRAIDRGYGKRVMGLGSAAAGLLFLGWSQLNSLFWLYAVMTGIGALHSATLYRAAFAVINYDQQIDDMQSAITSVTLWGGYSSTVIIPLIELMLAYVSWRETLIVLGLLNFLLCPLYYRFLPSDSGAREPALANPNAESGAKTERHSVAWAFGQPVFWLLLLGFSLHMTAISAFNFHLYPMLLDREFSAGQVALLIAFVGPAQVGGRLLLKFLRNRPVLIFWTALVFPVVYALMRVLPSEVLLLAPVLVLFGAVNGMMTILRALAIPAFLTNKSYGEINGALNVPVTLVQAVAPALAAAVWQAQQSYSMVFVGLTVISACVVLFLATVIAIHKKQEVAA